MLEDKMKEGDIIHIKGATTDFKQEVKSMEIDRKSVEKGEKGQKISFKVKDRVRENDDVFLVEENPFLDY